MSNLMEQRPQPRELGGITPDDSAAIDDFLGGTHENQQVLEPRIEIATTGTNGGVLQQIEAFLKARHCFRYNQATNKVEWKCQDKSQNDFVDMRDYDYNTVLRGLNMRSSPVRSHHYGFCLHQVLSLRMTLTRIILNVFQHGTGRRTTSNNLPIRSKRLIRNFGKDVSVNGWWPLQGASLMKRSLITPPLSLAELKGSAKPVGSVESCLKS